MTDKPCRHKPKDRERVSSCVDRCTSCGMLHAMIAGRSSIHRRWVKPDDPRVGPGEELTKLFLEVQRDKARAKALESGQ